MKLILIDPVARSVSEVEYDGNWENISKLIDCHTFDVARCDGFDLFIDDEGLMNDSPKFFMIGGYPLPVAGKALMHTIDARGRTVGVDVSTETVQENVSWITTFIRAGDAVLAVDTRGKVRKVEG